MDSVAATAAKAIVPTRLQDVNRRTANKMSAMQQAMTAIEKYRCAGRPATSMNDIASIRTASEIGTMPDVGRECIGESDTI